MNVRKTVATVTCAALLASCSGPGNWFGLRKHSSETRIVVAAAFYPLAEIAARVGGPHVEVLDLTPAGRDAHETELTAKQMTALDSAAIALYVGGDFQPGVEKAIHATRKAVRIDAMDVEGTKILGAGSAVLAPLGQNIDTMDPHLWLDPANMIAIAKQLQTELSALMPDHAAEFAANTDGYVVELNGVGVLIDSTFRPTATSGIRCNRSNAVVSHEGLGYLLHRAGLSMTPISGLNAEQQSSEKWLQGLATMVRNNGDEYVIAEALVPGDLAHSVADRAGVKVAVVNPLEGMTAADRKAGKNYVSVMRDNIATLVKVYDCR